MIILLMKYNFLKINIYIYIYILMSKIDNFDFKSNPMNTPSTTSSTLSTLSADSSSSNEKNSFIQELFNNKNYLYGIIGLVILFLIYVYYYYNYIDVKNIKCPKDCSKYINGNININGKICKLPNTCPVNCVYEKEDNYIKYSECNCDIDKPIKTPQILVQQRGNNTIKCPDNISCNDCKLVLKITNIIPLNPTKTNLILNFEPLKKSIYITKYYLKLHAYSNNTNSTVQLQFINNIDKKIQLQQEINMSNKNMNKEIIFNMNMSQPMLINSDSSVKLLILNPDKEEINIDYISSITIEYKNVL